jgi:hypothetical protein
MDLNDPYDGPILANPVAETLPQERWQANLSALGQLSARKRFIPPEAQVGILVPLHSAWLNRQAWRRIYATFSAAAEAKVQTRFFSDTQLEKNGLPQQIKLLLIPELEFVSAELRARLESFVQQGGMLRSVENPLFDQQAQPAPALAGVSSIDSQLVELFPLDRPAYFEALQHFAQEIRLWASKAQADPLSWVFDVTCENLPPAEQSWLREAEPSIEFRAWMYEHGSDWIYPYIKS